ncbi:MAG: Hsp70 family protein [Synergistaceae bacterium]|nr:Hsp70 family protein [Synergistaceae bacterium]
MRHHVGIDLGTTNSAICSYDGSSVRIWKSPEQNDVTPSAIYIDRRGNRHYGLRAYDMAPADEKNAATLFKRYMGTSERFSFERAGLSLSPEECSAEILKVLFGYLPEDVRGDPETATVITVPAAFNQVKKEATLEAARMAGIGRVALMQEPVAAIMAVMRAMRDKKQDGIFVVYDLGGGTFDVSIAQAHGGKVDLLTQDGKEMCGGRDWDRRIFNSVVIPWLKEKFGLPKDFMTNEQYRTLCRVALRAVEGAKIKLSSSETSVVHADETDTRSVDVQGKEIYLEVPLSRAIMEPLIDGLIDESIEVTRAAMQKAGLKASDIENIVFVGGPTKYGPLRDKVSEELALKALPPESVDPMTAVAEGAAIFAEAIDWSTEPHARKPTKAGASLGADISIRYEARATGDKAKIAFQVGTSARLFVEITSADTGWTSGRAELRQGTIMELPLSKEGGNSFRVVVYDEQGRTIPIQQSQLVITRTLATVGAIPASRSIRMVVLNKIGGTERLDRRYLIRKDEPLPKKGQLIFKAAETLKAGSDASWNFQL